jgi:hypothetical protein
MAAFSTFTAAEQRAVAKQSGSGDNTWAVAHAGYTPAGVICVRVQRYMTSGLVNGEWVEITDDGTV